MAVVAQGVVAAAPSEDPLNLRFRTSVATLESIKTSLTASQYRWLENEVLKTGICASVHVSERARCVSIWQFSGSLLLV